MISPVISPWIKHNSIENMKTDARMQKIIAIEHAFYRFIAAKAHAECLKKTSKVACVPSSPILQK